MLSLAGVWADLGGKSIDGRADEVKDGAAHGEYGTKRVILEIYEEMARSMRGGAAYRTRLNPPPGHPSVCHAGRG